MGTKVLHSNDLRLAHPSCTNASYSPMTHIMPLCHTPMRFQRSFRVLATTSEPQSRSSTCTIQNYQFVITLPSFKSYSLLSISDMELNLRKFFKCVEAHTPNPRRKSNQAQVFNPRRRQQSSNKVEVFDSNTTCLEGARMVCQGVQRTVGSRRARGGDQSQLGCL